MQLIDGQPVYSATDLVGFLACEHLTNLERAALAGLVNARSGWTRTWTSCGAGVRARGALPGRLTAAAGGSRDSYPTRLTTRPMARLARGEAAAAGCRDPKRRSGAETTSSSRPRSSTGDGSGTPTSWCESRSPATSRLQLRDHRHQARPRGPSERAASVVHLCRTAGANPRHTAGAVTVALGGGARAGRAARIADFMAFYRSSSAGSSAADGDGVPAVYPPSTTYPEPVEHCAVCRWWAMLRRSRADDDTFRWSRASPRSAPPTPEHGAGTRANLARCRALPPPHRGHEPRGRDRVREQARMQVAGEDERRVAASSSSPSVTRRGCPSGAGSPGACRRLGR